MRNDMAGFVDCHSPSQALGPDRFGSSKPRLQIAEAQSATFAAGVLARFTHDPLDIGTG
ncbi:MULTISPECIES: hypothetical protein [Phyllobacteriaceae]|jgi:hypothetical protein|uniref:hypothetical protein n=1 Tax=Phyllobacteriaceae TaxID=69277 RepID=UPI0004B9CC2A|nr:MULTISPECIES: hypothetical protein [Mesorhizobium]MDQ0327748.1 hypothetical protein [Mesorhizobium sp. YL-MeA3-2017]